MNSPPQGLTMTPQTKDLPWGPSKIMNPQMKISVPSNFLAKASQEIFDMQRHVSKEVPME